MNSNYRLGGRKMQGGGKLHVLGDEEGAMKRVSLGFGWQPDGGWGHRGEIHHYNRHHHHHHHHHHHYRYPNVQAFEQLLNELVVEVAVVFEGGKLHLAWAWGGPRPSFALKTLLDWERVHIPFRGNKLTLLEVIDQYGD
jgi:hypothetical protein